MNTWLRLLLICAIATVLAIGLAACDGNGSGDGAGTAAGTARNDDADHDHDHGDDDHDHADHDHADDDHDHDHAMDDDEHDHDEVTLGTTMVGDMRVEVAQGHGMMEAGKEMHLVVKLPYDDGGETTVRAWIGTEDRMGSLVAMGDYAASHDDYDIHVEAPDPLPDDTMWWIEIEKPDGTIATGSIRPR